MKLEALKEECGEAKTAREEQARSQGGCRGCTYTPLWNDIHNTNFLIQERPFDCF